MPQIRSERRKVRRVANASTVIVLVLSAWAAPVSLGGLGETCVAAAGQLRVWLVVDFGELPPPPGIPSVLTKCVVVADGSTGAAVVQAGIGGLRWGSSGLLCAIGNQPRSPECGDRTPAGYRYWSYWHGGASWTYSGLGPDNYRVRDGDVEGWHFVSGKGNPTDPPPGAGSGNGCPPPPTSAPPTNPQPRPTAPPPQPPRPGGGGSPSAGGTNSGSGNGGAGVVPGPGSSGGGAGGGNGASGGGSANPSSTGPDATGSIEPGGSGDLSASSEGAAGGSTDGATDDSASASIASDDAATGGEVGVDPRSEVTAERNGLGKNEEQAVVLATPASASAPASSSTGVFAGLALIALIGGGAYVQFRRRPSLL